MAKIEEFFELNSDLKPHKTTVQCGYAILQTETGTLLHLSTYGSQDRRSTGVTQTLQIDEAAARKILELIRATFPDL